MVVESRMRARTIVAGLALALAAGCADDAPAGPHDPDTAPRVAVDRFSDAAGTIFRRSLDPTLPGPDQPIELDTARFMTLGLGPDGSPVRYYHLDVRPRALVPVYRLRRAGDTAPVAGQLSIFDYVPGDHGYNDLWRVLDVEVPADYVANTAVDSATLVREGYPITPTTEIVNCPMVPAGSTARRRAGSESAELRRGWYRGQVVPYFTFEEAPVAAGVGGAPTAPIYVAFRVDPGQPGGGPPSGFRTEPGSDQTHNVLGALPGQPGYSPLWSVQIYPTASFDDVHDLTSARAVPPLASDVALVNCLVVERP